jgi:hypothetical protein
MTYQEIKDRLSKCESTLEKFKNGVNIDNKEAHAKINKLTILKESLTKKLAEAQSKTYLVTPKKGQTTAVAMSDDETDALKDADDVKAIKGIDGEEIKEQEGLKFSIDETKSIAKRVGKAVAQSLKSLGDEVAHMKAKSIEENSFEIYVQYKNDADDEFSFYIVDDSLHLTDFSFDKELTDVGVKPSGEAIVNVDVLANELTKHFKSVNEKVDEKDKPELKKLSKALTNSVKAHQDQKKALDKAINTEGEVSEAPEGMYYIKIPKDAASQNKAQVIFNDLHGINYELNDDPDGIFMYFKKEDFDAGVIDDLEGDGVHILDTNIPNVNEDAEEDAKNDADYEAGWHDDPRKDEGNDDFISKIRSAVQGPEVDAIFAAAQKEIDNGDAESMADALAIAADQYYEYYDSKGNEDGTEVAKYIMRSLTQSKSNVQDFSKLKDGDYKNWTVDEKMTQKEDTDIGHQDDEPNMLGASAMETAEYAAKLVKKLQRYDQHDGEVDFPHWWQKKLILARDYISAAYHYLDSEEKQPAIDQLALENLTFKEPKGIDKVAGGIPYRREGNKFIISMYLPDDVKERLLAKAKKNGFKAAPNMSGGVTIMAKDNVNERLSGDAREAIYDLQNILDQAAQLGDEARQIVKQHFPNELSAGEAYDVFSFGTSSNSYDKTLETLISDIERTAEEEDMDMDEGRNVDDLYDITVHTMKRLAAKYKAGDKSVVPHLKKLTDVKKKLEQEKIKKASNIGKGQELDEAGPGFKHDCAAKVVHEKHGKGNTIPEKHTLVKEGNKYVVTHYDVLFENGNTVLDIPVNELKIETTNEHWHKGYKKKKK